MAEVGPDRSDMGGARRVLVCGHRGYSSRFPENTLSAFAAAVGAGVEMIELDVRLSADGVPVVIHDDTLERTTDGSGPVAEKTWDELCGLDAGSWKDEAFGFEGLPMLASVFKMVPPQVQVNIELKQNSPELCAAVMEVVAGFKAERRVVLGSFHIDMLMEVKMRRPSVWVQGITARPDETIEALNDSSERFYDSFSLDRRSIERRHVDWFNERGIAVWCWTVNDAEEAVRLGRMGVDLIVSDDPPEIIKALEAERLR